MKAPDVDTRSVVASLRDALATSGMSQRGLARALGTSAPRLSTYLSGTTRPSAHFCVRAQRIAQCLAASNVQGLMSAPVTADAVRGHLRSDALDWAWRILLQGRDHLRLMLTSQDDDLDGAWEAAPDSTGSTEFDALLAALARREFENVGRTAPDWTHLRALPEPWIPAHPFLSQERVIANTPPWLSELNIYVPERDLHTA